MTRQEEIAQSIEKAYWDGGGRVFDRVAHYICVLEDRCDKLESELESLKTRSFK